MALKYKIDKIPEYYWLNQETSNLADDEKRFHSLIGQLKKLKEMVGKKGFRNICINSQDDIGRSPLYKACAMGNFNVVKYLIEKGADVNAESKKELLYARIPLHKAVENCNLKIVKHLLLKGVRIQEKNEECKTALHIAVENDDPEIVKCLIQYGADVNSCDSFYITPLHIAVVENKIEFVKILLQRGAIITAKSKYGETPLDLATKRGHLDIINLLTEKNAQNLRNAKHKAKRSAKRKAAFDDDTSDSSTSDSSRSGSSTSDSSSDEDQRASNRKLAILISGVKRKASTTRSDQNSATKSRSNIKMPKVDQIDDQTIDTNLNSNKEITNKSNTNSNRKQDGNEADKNENNCLNSERNDSRVSQIDEASLNSNKEILIEFRQEKSCTNTRSKSESIGAKLIEGSSNSSREIIIELRQEIANLRMVKDDILAIKDAMNEKLSENIVNKFDSSGQSRLEEVKELKQNLKDLKNEMDDLQEKLDQKNQKLAIQKGKCDKLENQQNILMQILNIPENERNFGTLREALENLKNDYVIEKERAEHLATIS